MEKFETVSNSATNLPAEETNKNMTLVDDNAGLAALVLHTKLYR